MPGEKACSPEPLQYLSGFGATYLNSLMLARKVQSKHLSLYLCKKRAGNEFCSEALPGALPVGQNNPQVSLSLFCVLQAVLCIAWRVEASRVFSSAGRASAGLSVWVVRRTSVRHCVHCSAEVRHSCWTPFLVYCVWKQLPAQDAAPGADATSAAGCIAYGPQSRTSRFTRWTSPLRCSAATLSAR